MPSRADSLANLLQRCDDATRDTLEYAKQLALAEGTAFVCTRHLVAGALHERPGEVRSVLAARHVDTDRLEACLNEFVVVAVAPPAAGVPRLPLSTRIAAALAGLPCDDASHTGISFADLLEACAAEAVQHGDCATAALLDWCSLR